MTIDAIEKMRADLSEAGDREHGTDDCGLASAMAVHRLATILQETHAWSPAMSSRIRGFTDDPALRRLVDRLLRGDEDADFRLREYVARRLSAPVSPRYRTRIEAGLARIEERMWDDG
ncbi:hypothetical protein O7627_03275 [Solwaraspora sp. WMMD1047]|uniref:hypothetical protein n=1 Tax=Solwaraspora sp. WMMD1047 TaxID=3016102 RepID=UPI0024159ECC|nr:hypothetical protein [Solwaraspora sp. WMMD1047]MDG4828325.1 hypothetical protein [Solwaraspora sp. WMMD1047]